MVCGLVCIGVYFLEYLLPVHVKLCIGVYSKFLYAIMGMYLLTLVCIETWHVLHLFVGIVIYREYSSVLPLLLIFVCMVSVCVYWYVLECMACVAK